MKTRGTLKTMAFFGLLALIGQGPCPVAAAAEQQSAFEQQLQTLTPAQLEELQKRVAEFKVEGDAQAMTLEEIRAQYVAFIEKTVAEMSR